MMLKIFFLVALTTLSPSLFANRVVNVYVWGGEIPKKVIRQFEQETGVKVHFSTYDSNETMYAKLKASSKTIYDVILPSAYFVERMQKLGMLNKLDHNRLSNLKNLAERFVENDYDPGNQYSIPLIWGATGIFYNRTNIANPPDSWQQLWQKKWRNQLMLLDDSREVFAIALMSLGFNPNDNNPEHIKAAYQHLLKLIPNIKLFASDSVQAIMIDEDASLGASWNGDAFKARAENSAIGFHFPKDGFVVWVDCLAIPKNPPHLNEAYEFINFMLKPESGESIALIEGHAITNEKGRARLPEKIRNNKTIYPDSKTMKRAHFQRDVGERTLAIYNNYWEQFKLSF
ncbi:ABC transporter substrate-binding protein [Legionella spiritensis]|uniref:ABC transporter substrate-binding protein n=1 Tax=Legionella spiritensis TaxID=452 RepID=UPI000F7093AA|nr:spermidine/putrescine ABC transporter substrate-binding protein [Legionella spiritensis]VEG89865.1 spermidine/putrescine transport system substrate-binding protein [Legionella spiritensis]